MAHRVNRWDRTPAVLLVTACAAVASAALQAKSADELVVKTTARAIQPGEVIRIDVLCECGGVAPTATLFDTSLVLAAVAGTTRWQGFAGVDLDVAPGEYLLTVTPADESGRIHTTSLRVTAKLFQTRQLRVAPVYVDPPADTIDRILSEAAHLEALFAAVSTRAWSGAFLPPLPGRSSNNFGARSVFNGEHRNPHAGLDYSSPTGTPVMAPAAGRVVLARDLYFTGQTVIIDHGLGLFSVLAHLSAITVAQDTVIDRGAIAGRVGATGRATGPHLHWGVRLRGARVDPLSLIAATN
jgi:murein DD-endopeptidase MepM/ murein hydrolase activator NlpD